MAGRASHTTSNSPISAGTKSAAHRLQDNLIVFHLPETEQWEAALSRMRCAGLAPVPSFNPYWHIVGATYEDADGYRVVFQRAPWQDAT